MWGGEAQQLLEGRMRMRLDPSCSKCSNSFFAAWRRSIYTSRRLDLDRRPRRSQEEEETKQQQATPISLPPLHHERLIIKTVHAIHASSGWCGGRLVQDTGDVPSAASRPCRHAHACVWGRHSPRPPPAAASHTAGNAHVIFRTLLSKMVYRND
ncbi:hypothetical protein GWK47_013756 [Chionoecetes opilio]|uniref:Uncharacterized protein n=1 Tax=Chionoecetes opilio TaxID=41210 RepID=A0A8J5CKT5_CHIOP|nr:hypothetical protein GWK47_013756 [Chionoecetes opilio]